MRSRLRFAGLATEDDETAKAEIEKDKDVADQREVKKAGDLAKAAPPKPPAN
jgi:hypothetical protein